MFQTLINVDNNTQKGTISLTKVYNTQNYLHFSISDLADNTTYWTFTVSIIAFSDISPFVLDDDIILSFSIAGGGGFTNFINIKCGESSGLVKGDLVYISSVQTADRVIVKKAKADSPSTMPCIGVCNQALNLNENGVAVTYGSKKGLNTNIFSEGDTAYVSATEAGKLSTKPIDSTLLIQNVGIVTKKSINNGALFVTGIGRLNDIPNAPINTTILGSEHLYMLKDSNNRFDKISSDNLAKSIELYANQYPTGSEPSGTLGQIIYDTSINKLKVFTGSSWETITSS